MGVPAGGNHPLVLIVSPPVAKIHVQLGKPITRRPWTSARFRDVKNNKWLSREPGYAMVFAPETAFSQPATHRFRAAGVMEDLYPSALFQDFSMSDWEFQ